MKKACVVLFVAAAGCASGVRLEGPRSAAWAPDDFGVAAASPLPAGPAPSARPIDAMIDSVGASSSARAWSGAGGGDEGPEVRVTAPRESGSSLREERRVGSNEQPEWTTQRTFTTVRSYVIAPGQIEVEQWYKLQHPRDSGPVQHWQTEVGVGLEGGWQLDLYENYGREPGGPVKHEGVQFEVRKALAKWGEIPLNPTLYLEYVMNHRAADKVEAKVLFAEELAPGIHWAGNLIYEQETGGARETELAFSTGIMHTLIDSKFSAGLEIKAERVTGVGFQSRDAAVNEFLIGPSFQWRPCENMHVDFAPLFGVTKSDRRDPRTEFWIVIGYDFGPGHDEGARAPTSTRSN